MNKIENPGIQLDNVIKNETLLELSTDYAELAIDGILDEGVLRDIPAVGSVIGLVKFGNSINQYIFTKKVYSFLFELKSVPQNDRKQMIDKINESRKKQSKVGQVILELLDKVESDHKPAMLGKLMKAVIEEKIDFKMYLRLAHIVKSMFIDDLNMFKSFSSNITSNEIEIRDEMTNFGLIEYKLPQLNLLNLGNSENKKEVGHYRSLTTIGKALADFS